MKIKKVLNSTTAKAIIATSIFRLLSIQALINRHFNIGDTKFFLYNRSNLRHVELSTKDLTNYNTTRYFYRQLRNKRLIVLTHGWMADGFASSTQLIKNAYLSVSDVNVVVVDWTNAASFTNYIISAYMTDTIAKKIKNFIETATVAMDINAANIHLIGHSLGAHVLGRAGTFLREANVTVGRITGIDPARHFFEWPKYFAGIDNASASFVDIIHTSRGAIGYEHSVGHVDFFPNGGLRQPHCCYLSHILAMTCEHSCGYVYFAETVLGTKYTAYKCDSYWSFLQGKCERHDTQDMGELCSTNATGSYFLSID